MNEEKKGFMNKIKKEIRDHRWLCIMCVAALLLIVTILSIPVNNGKSILSTIIKNKEEVVEVANSNFSITSIEKKSSGKYIDNNEEFIVTTREGTLDDVKTHLFMEPALNYEIEEQGKDKYLVRLRDVPRDTLININYVTDEVVDYRWAFQSNKDFKVTSVYPTDGASTVSPTTIIEVVLSSAYKGDISKYFSIEPKVEGKFEYIGRVVRFKPSKPLEYDTSYTVHIEKGLKNDDLVMEEGYTSTFSTYKDSSSDFASYSSISVDGINTFKVDEPPMFRVYGINTKSNTTIGKITISKFKNVENFMKYINKEKNYEIEDLGEYKFTTNSLYKDCIILEKGLSKGYYLENVYLSSGELFTTIPVQVSDLSAYAFTSDRDLLVWVGSNNKLLKDININYKDNNFKTDKDGVGILKNYNTKDEKIDYVFVGDKDPIVIGINNNDNSVYPNAYLYTDRPLYKNTDVVNVWGFIPLSYFEDDFNKEDLVLKMEDNAIDFNIDSVGIVTATIKLDNHKDDYSYLDLSYKNSIIAGRSFEIKNYQNQIYTYKTITDSNYVYAGNNYEFDVEIEHVSGMTVSNKEVIVSYNNKDYKSVTGNDGKAHFSLPTTKSDYDGNSVNNETVTIKNSDVLYNDYTSSFMFYKIDRLVDMDIDRVAKLSNKKIKAKVYTLVKDSKEKNIPNKDYNLDLSKFRENYNGDVTILVIETHTIMTQTGTRYNEFTKENQPIYEYSYEKNPVVNERVTVSNGELDYKANFEAKKADDFNTYSYYYYLTVQDSNGSNYEIEGWFNNDISQFESDYYRGYVSDYDIGDSGSDYDVFRYYLDDQLENHIYSINDKMNFILKSYRNEIINEKAKLLEIKYKTKIVETTLYDDTSDITNKFNKKDEPGINITGAYYINDRFYRLPNSYYDYRKEDSNVDITIKTDKKEYRPRDEVEVDINTKDYKGNNVATYLNISVVDESVFNLADDYTNILGQLNNNNYYHSYLYSTYRDYELFNNSGGKGGTSGPGRYDFGDTIYFNNIATDNNGNVKIKFKLNDSVTSFRITVHAANSENQVGSNYRLIQSKLPLSISYTEPRGVKSCDDMVLNANVLSDNTDSTEVTFEIEGKGKKKVDAVPGKTVYANFGKLDVGVYNVKISVKNKDDSDSVLYKVSVIETQEEVAVKTTKNVKDLKELKVKKNPITIELYRNGFSKYLVYLDKMNNYERRLDTILSSRQSMYYQNKYYGEDNGLLDSNLSEFEINGFLKYLPNEQMSVELSAFVNYYSPGLFELKKSNVYDSLDDDSVISDYNKVIEFYLLLASMKEPVLDDLNYLAENSKYGDDEHRALLALAFAFIGDYDTAEELYNKRGKDIDNGLVSLLSTFVDKENASTYIDQVLKDDKANRYVYFAMMSYFMNNNAKLSEKESVTVSYGKTNKKVELQGIKIVKLDITENDLKTLKFDTDYEDILVNYYYQGELDKTSDKVHDNLKISFDKNSYQVGSYAKLNLDVSALGNKGGFMKVYLPNGLRLSGDLGNDAWISSNRIDYLIIYLSNDRKSNNISIPLYVSSIGSYKINPVVLKIDDDYYISNELEVNISE